MAKSLNFVHPALTFPIVLWTTMTLRNLIPSKTIFSLPHLLLVDLHVLNIVLLFFYHLLHLLYLLQLFLVLLAKKWNQLLQIVLLLWLNVLMIFVRLSIVGSIEGWLKEIYGLSGLRWKQWLILASNGIKVGDRKLQELENNIFVCSLLVEIIF